MADNGGVSLVPALSGLGVDNAQFSMPEIEDLKARVKSVTAFGDFSVINFTMIGLGEPARVFLLLDPDAIPYQQKRVELAFRSGDRERLLDAYLEAFWRKDIDTIVSMLKADAVWEMPPFTGWYQGARTIGNLISTLLHLAALVRIS